MHIYEAKFVTSVADIAMLPEPWLPEFAVIGRSNVGKSTLINMLTQRAWLAKSSSTPGKTQLINIFSVNEKFLFIDLPWYGYAKANIVNRQQWIDRTRDYVTTRTSLRQLFVLIDGSIPPQQIDLDFCHTLHQDKVPFAIIITKTDKAPQREIDKNIAILKQQLQAFIPTLPQIFSSSSKKNRGRDHIMSYIETLI